MVVRVPGSKTWIYYSRYVQALLSLSANSKKKQWTRSRCWCCDVGGSREMLQYMREHSNADFPSLCPLFYPIHMNTATKNYLQSRNIWERWHTHEWKILYLSTTPPFSLSGMFFLFPFPPISFFFSSYSLSFFKNSFIHISLSHYP